MSDGLYQKEEGGVASVRVLGGPCWARAIIPLGILSLEKGVCRTSGAHKGSMGPQREDESKRYAVTPGMRLGATGGLHVL